MLEQHAHCTIQALLHPYPTSQINLATGFGSFHAVCVLGDGDRIFQNA
jgi:hypothetical protein